MILQHIRQTQCKGRMLQTKQTKPCRAGAANKTRRARETGRTNVTDRVKKGK